MKRLQDKVAVITGGNSGIGAAVAELFAREGAKVVLVARRVEKLKEVKAGIEAEGGAALAVSADVTSLADCQRVFQETVRAFGRVDILVNNAGMLDYNNSVARMSDELWNTVIATNQTSVFQFCREALKYMEAQGSGSIVNVSSLAGVSCNSGAAYTASKCAVLAMTVNIALQFAGTGIRCNAVCPGQTRTPMVSDPAYYEQMDHAFMEACFRHIDPSVGESDPMDQAAAVLFLASDEARGITGQWLLVDRGAY